VFFRRIEKEEFILGLDIVDLRGPELLGTPTLVDVEGNTLLLPVFQVG